MKPNESKFNKRDLKKKSWQFMSGSHCGSLPQVSKKLATSLLIHLGFQTKKCVHQSDNSNRCYTLLPVSPCGMKLTIGKEYKL